jgi:hypothetical protein
MTATLPVGSVWSQTTTRCFLLLLAWHCVPNAVATAALEAAAVGTVTAMSTVKAAATTATKAMTSVTTTVAVMMAAAVTVMATVMVVGAAMAMATAMAAMATPPTAAVPAMMKALFDQISHYHYYNYTNGSWVDFLPSPAMDKYQIKLRNHL